MNRPEGPTTLELGSDEVIEVPLLLPGWQMSALEQAAHRRGLTAGEMVRSLLSDFFARPQPVQAPPGQTPPGPNGLKPRALP
jgi:hypothetical protein